MAHFAKLDENNRVEQVIVISNDNTHDADGVEQESLGITFCKTLFGEDTNWVQTSYNGSTRGKYAEVGDIYNPTINTFEYDQAWQDEQQALLNSRNQEEVTE
jgi:hypothetical protein